MVTGASETRLAGNGSRIDYFSVANLLQIWGPSAVTPGGHGHTTKEGPHGAPPSVHAAASRPVSGHSELGERVRREVEVALPEHVREGVVRGYQRRLAPQGGGGQHRIEAA